MLVEPGQVQQAAFLSGMNGAQHCNTGEKRPVADTIETKEVAAFWPALLAGSAHTPVVFAASSSAQL